MNSKNIADYIYLAEASYADFTGIAGITSDKDKKEQTVTKIEKADKPTQFAELVTKNYTVEAHWKDRADGISDPESGFSGTLFKSKEGKYVIAMRGTAGNQDLVETELDINANRNYYNI